MIARVPLVDLGAEHAPLVSQIDDAIAAVVRSGAYVLGTEVEAFETTAANFLGAPHAVGVSCGTDALVVALAALGIGHGDSVITTPFSFFSSTEAILRVGARPRFVDVHPRSLCLDVDRVASELTPRTRAVLPVHLYGCLHGIDALADLAERRGMPIVEDAAQAFGATLSGRAAGTWGAAGCFSFFPTKVLGALGDAGLVVTRDAPIAEQARRLRQHGAAGEEYVALGGNFRLDAIQAAVLSLKLRHVAEWIRLRRAHGAAYDAAFAGVAGLRAVDRGESWNGAVYTVRVLDGRRDRVRQRLHERGIGTGIYYPRPIHLQPALVHLGLRPGAFPESERAATEVLSLPVYPAMTGSQRDAVIDAMLAALT